MGQTSQENIVLITYDEEGNTYSKHGDDYIKNIEDGNQVEDLSSEVVKFNIEVKSEVMFNPARQGTETMRGRTMHITKPNISRFPMRFAQEQ